jgi:hypothetical protein
MTACTKVRGEDSLSRIFGHPKKKRKIKKKKTEKEKKRDEIEWIGVYVMRMNVFLVEWVAYHHLMGVSQFLVFVNEV